MRLSKSSLPSLILLPKPWLTAVFILLSLPAFGQFTVTLCKPGVATLVATGPWPYEWYEENTQKPILSFDQTYITKALNATTVFYYTNGADLVKRKVTVVVTRRTTPEFESDVAACIGTPNPYIGQMEQFKGAFVGNGTSFSAQSTVVPTASDSSISLEASINWTGPNAAGTTQAIFYNGDSDANGYGLMITNGGNLYVSLGGNGSAGVLSSSVTLSTGKWYHVAITRSAEPGNTSGVWTLYVDGLAYSLTNSGTKPKVPAGAGFYVGRNSKSTTNPYFFKGKIDEVRIWRYARTDKEINEARTWPVTALSGLKGYWKFDEASSNITPDASPSNIPLTVSNPAALGLSASYEWNFAGVQDNNSGPFANYAFTTGGNKTITYLITDLTGCKTSTSRVLNANSNIPPAITASPSSLVACVNSTVNLNASGAGIILGNDFNTPLSNGWEGYLFGYTGSQYIVESRDHVIKDAYITSPAFSTLNLSDMKIRLRNYMVIGAHNGGDVQLSLDKTNWTMVAQWGGNHGRYDNYAVDTIPVPAAFENKPAVYLRLLYNDDPPSAYSGWYVDNLEIIAGNTFPQFSWSSNSPFKSNDQSPQNVVITEDTYFSVTASTGCKSNTVSFLVTAAPVPTATISGDALVCAGSPTSKITFTGAGAVSPYTFKYSINNVMQTPVTTTSGNSVMIQGPSTSATGEYIYRLVEVSSANSCARVVTGSARVFIAPLPEVSADPSLTVCSGTTINLPFHYVTGESPLTIQYAYPGHPQNVGPALMEPAGVAVYTVTGVTDAYGCFRNYTAVPNPPATTVTIKQTPVVNLSTATAKFCHDSLTLSVTGSPSYEWSPAYGLNKTTGASVKAAPKQHTTYTVSSTANGCTMAKTVLVESYYLDVQPPIASAYDVCPGTQVTLTGNGVTTDETAIEQNFEVELNTGDASWTGGGVLIGGSHDVSTSWVKKEDNFAFQDHLDRTNFLQPGSNFVMANYDGLPDGGKSANQLLSPGFSTEGFSGMTLTLDHAVYLNDNPNTVIRVQMSETRNNWTDIAVWTRNQFSGRGPDRANFQETKVVIPAAFENKQRVYIRLYSAVEGFSRSANFLCLWAINKVSVKGQRKVRWEWFDQTRNLFLGSSYTQTISTSPSINTVYVGRATNENGCVLNYSLDPVVVRPVPDVSIPPVSSVQPGGTASVRFVVTAGEPDRFSIVSGPRKLPGFTDMTNVALPNSAFGIPIFTSTTTPVGTYDFVFRPASSTNGCNGTDIPFTIQVGNQNASLSALTTNPGPLSPAFDPENAFYDPVYVRAGIESINVTATLGDPNATLTINDLPAMSGVPTTVLLNADFGQNTIVVKVTAQAGTQKSYQFTVFRTRNLDNANHEQTNAKAAYSLRQLAGNYLHRGVDPPEPVPGFTNAAQPAIRVRRNIDNAMLDIGFNANGHLDTLTMLRFAGPGDLFVSVWYDQSGFDFDAVQTESNNQPRIAHARTIDRKNGAPTLLFSGSAVNNTYLTSPPFQGFAERFSIFAVAGVRTDQPSGLNALLSKTSGGKPAPWDISGGTFKIGNGTSELSTVNLAKPFTAAQPFATWFFFGEQPGFGNTLLNNLPNSASQSNHMAYADALTSIVIGSDQPGVARLNGWISELILFDQSQPYNDLIENQMQTYIGPAITSFTPSSGNGPVEMTIRGHNFTGVSAVSIGGVAVASFQVVNDNLIMAQKTQPGGGDLLVTTAYGTARKTGFFYGVPPGNALHFDGIDDYVRLNNKISNANFTIELWIRTNADSKTGTGAYNGSILMDSDVSGQANDFVLSVLNNKIAFLDGSADVNTYGVTDLTDGRWHHVAVVRKAGQNVKIYLDGNLEATGLAGADILNANPIILLGGNPGNTDISFDGWMDELRIWNEALPLALLNEFRSQVVNADNPMLAAYHSFDVQTLSNTTQLQDLTGSAGAGTLYNFDPSGNHWVESYAMVVPDVSPAVEDISENGFTARWIRPQVGVVEGYQIRLSTNPELPFPDPGTRVVFAPEPHFSFDGLESGNTYYYRVMCLKSGILDQASLSNLVQVKIPFATDILMIGLNGSPLQDFDPKTLSYTMTIDAASLTISGVTGDPMATIELKINAGNFVPIVQNTPSDPLDLAPGLNTISLKVTAQDGSTSKIYTITVTRPFSPPGNALRFAGSKTDVNLEEYVQIDKKIESTDFTLETWIRTSENSITGSQGFSATALFNSDKGGTANDFTMGILNNKIAFFDGNKNATTIGEKTVTDNRWHHVAVVRKAGVSVKIYIDGKLDKENATGAGSAALNANSYIALGGNPGYAPVAFHGSMDEVRIWKVARSETDLLANMLRMVSPTHSDLMAYYNFDTGNQENAILLTDLTGNGNTGTLFHFNPLNTSWIESYAMVVPVALGASGSKSTEFTANWSAPALGIANRYFLDVSTSETFAAGNFLPGFEALEVTETSKKVMLPTTGSGREMAGTSYYYRVRADKASIPGQGAYSATVTVTSNPLPVNLISFTGKKSENINLLEWKVTGETQFGDYEIQRSSNGKSFSTIGLVNALSNGQSGVTRYQFSDSLNSSNTSDYLYYRLKMVDLDASFTMSRTIAIKNDIDRIQIGSIYPNPLVNKTGFVEITMDQAGSWKTQIMNAAGIVLSTSNLNLQQGSNKVRLDLKGIMPGIHLIKFDNGVQQIVRKMVLE